jgi:hypothetical protein
MMFDTKPVRALVIAAAAVGLYGCSSLVGHLADRVYPALPETFDMEAPPTPGAIPPSADIVALIGGKGEGLSCSIPSVAESALFSRSSNTAPVSMQFRQACAYHDFCYRHGEATYGYSQNDCDFALQRFSYRLCRQIETGSTHAGCEQRARQVLLGVRMFGGKAFQAGGASSYFEFDPMPLHADNYMVGRIVAPAKSDHGELVALAFDQHTLRSRIIDWNSQDPLAGAGPRTAFPMGVIPTPPSVVRTSAGDRLLAFSRVKATNTAASTIEFDRPAGGAQREYVASAANFAIDHDASEQIIRSSGDGQLEALAFSHRPVRLYKGRVDLKQVHETKIEHIDWTDPDTTTGAHDYYRLLQHPPLLVRDEQGEAALVLRRGADAVGTNYQTKAPMLLFRLGAGVTHAQAVTDGDDDRDKKAGITEEDEPLVSVPVSDRRSLLVSLHAAKQHRFGKDEPASLHVFEVSGEKVMQRNPIALDAVGVADKTWLLQPVQFVRGHEGQLYVFFSRACPDNAACDWSGTKESEDVLYDFRYFEFVAKPPSDKDDTGETHLKLAGAAQVRIDIAAQFKMLAKATPDGIHDIRADAFEGADHEQQWAAAVRADLVKRWRQGQVIPGYLAAAGSAIHPRPLDVAVLFPGHPAESLRLSGTAGTPGSGASLVVNDKLAYASSNK